MSEQAPIIPHVDPAGLYLILGRLEGKAQAMDAKLDTILDAQEKLGSRVSALETARARLKGAITLAASCAGLVGAAVVAYGKTILHAITAPT